MKEYLEAEVSEVIQRIKHYRKPNSFIFSIFTDMHVHPNIPRTMSTMYDTFDTIKAVDGVCNIDGLFFLGDTPKINKDYPPSSWSQEMIDSLLDDIYRRMKEITPNSFMVAGNHDGAYAAPPEQLRFYETCIKNNIPDCKITKNIGKGYYYLDYPEKNVRCICLLSCFCENGRTVHGYMPDQLRWLYNDALCVPIDTSIFLFSHIPPKCNYPAEWSQNLIELLNSYKNRTMCEIGGEIFDHSSAKGELRAMFVGDGHYDWINKEGLPFPAIETASSALFEVRLKTLQWWMPHEAISPKRTWNTVDETAWDTVIYDPDDNDLVIIRFGAGEDRYCRL